MLAVFLAFLVGAAVGAGLTMQLGGAVTEVMTFVSAWRIPALMTYPRNAHGSAGGATTTATGEVEAAVEPPQATLAGSAVAASGHGAVPAPPGWELNDAAKAAAAAESATPEGRVVEANNQTS